MNRHFGGPGRSGSRGVEFSADCMAILQGATWTHYIALRQPDLASRPDSYEPLELVPASSKADSVAGWIGG
jgi:hypothetical protein